MTSTTATGIRNTFARRQLSAALLESSRHGRCLQTRDRNTARNLQRAAKRGNIIRPLPGIYAYDEHWEEIDARDRVLECLRALAQKHPNWIFAGPSAAIAQGLSVSYRDAEHVYIAADTTSRSSWLSRLYVTDDIPVYASGVRVTSLVRTAYDCMRMLGFRRGLAVADSVLRTSGMPLEELSADIERRFRGRKGIRKARDILPWADARSANGGESMARAAMIELGYEVPDLQHELVEPIDGQRYFADYYWEIGPNHAVAGELDGKEKYENMDMTGGRDALAVMTDERLRESRISACVVQVMRFSYRDSQDDQRFVSILDAFGIPKRPQE